MLAIGWRQGNTTHATRRQHTSDEKQKVMIWTNPTGHLFILFVLECYVVSKVSFWPLSLIRNAHKRSLNNTVWPYPKTSKKRAEQRKKVRQQQPATKNQFVCAPIKVSKPNKESVIIYS
jgi:hypothetical protein